MTEANSDRKISARTVITLEESMRNLPLNMIGEKGDIISTLSPTPQAELGSGKAKYATTQKIYGSGRPRQFAPDCLSLRFDMQAADLSARDAAETMKRLALSNIKHFGGLPFSAHTNDANGDCIIEIKLPKTEKSLKAAHQLIDFYKTNRSIAKELGL